MPPPIPAYVVVEHLSQQAARLPGGIISYEEALTLTPNNEPIILADAIYALWLIAICSLVSITEQADWPDRTVIALIEPFIELEGPVPKIRTALCR